jgi:hypothetical protein
MWTLDDQHFQTMVQRDFPVTYSALHKAALNRIQMFRDKKHLAKQLEPIMCIDINRILPGRSYRIEDPDDFAPTE